MLFAMSDCCKTPVELVRLWMHEAMRVYRDKLLDEKDFETFDKVIKDMVKKGFEVSYQICNTVMIVVNPKTKDN